MKKYILWLVALVCLVAAPVKAQTPGWTQVSATNIIDGKRQKLASGKIVWTATDASGNVLKGYKIGGDGGQIVKGTLEYTIVDGAFDGIVPDTELTSPAHICFNISVKDATGSTVIGGGTPLRKTGYECLQPSGDSWSFDQFIPAIGNIPNGVSVDSLSVRRLNFLDGSFQLSAGGGNGNGGASYSFSTPLVNANGTVSCPTCSVIGHTHLKAAITDFPTTWAWSALSGVPLSFPPSAHTHDWSQVINKPSAYPPSAHGHTFLDLPLCSTEGDVYKRVNGAMACAPDSTSGGAAAGVTSFNGQIGDIIFAPDWSTILNKPSTYTPTAHTHAQSEVTNLVTDLAAKSPVGHTHTGVYEPANVNIQSHIASTSNPHSTTKAQVGLGNVTDDAQVKRSEMGAVNGVPTLGADGKVPAAQLPALAPVYAAIVSADAQVGADWCVKVNAADALLGTNPGTIQLTSASGNLTCSVDPVINAGHTLQELEGATYRLTTHTLKYDSRSAIIGTGRPQAPTLKQTMFFYTGTGSAIAPKTPTAITYAPVLKNFGLADKNAWDGGTATAMVGIDLTNVGYCDVTNVAAYQFSKTGAVAILRYTTGSIAGAYYCRFEHVYGTYNYDGMVWDNDATAKSNFENFGTAPLRDTIINPQFDINGHYAYDVRDQSTGSGGQTTLTFVSPKAESYGVVGMHIAARANVIEGAKIEDHHNTSQIALLLDGHGCDNYATGSFWADPVGNAATKVVDNNTCPGGAGGDTPGNTIETGSAFGALKIGASYGLPRTTNWHLWFGSDDDTNRLGRMYIGDGTGKRVEFATRSNSVDTPVMGLKDSSEFFMYRPTTYTDETHFEKGRAYWNGNIFQIGTDAGSAGGVYRSICLAPSNLQTLCSNSTSVFFNRDNVVDIGTATGYKPRTIYAGTSVDTPTVILGGVNLQTTLDTKVTSSCSGCASGISFFFSGSPTLASTTLVYNPSPYAFSVPLNCAGSSAKSKVAATGTTTLSLKKNGTTFGTATFSAGVQTATLSCTATTFSVGDVLEIVGGGDQTLADIGGVIYGTRN